MAVKRVGVPGLEPGTSASQTQRASLLRHTPLCAASILAASLADKGRTNLSMTPQTKEPLAARGGHHKRPCWLA